MHAGYPIMAFIPQAKEMVNLEELEQKGNWGAFHELGHNHQEPEWTWDGLGEVTVNLFSMYVFDTILPNIRQHDAVSPEKIQKEIADFKAKGKLEGPWGQLVPYIELKHQFGWQPFKNVFAKYQKIPKDQKPKKTQDRVDLWVVMFSEEVGYNLAPFYQSWKIDVSPEAVAKVSKLPAWSGPGR